MAPPRTLWPRRALGLLPLPMEKGADRVRRPTAINTQIEVMLLVLQRNIGVLDRLCKLLQVGLEPRRELLRRRGNDLVGGRFHPGAHVGRMQGLGGLA